MALKVEETGSPPGVLILEPDGDDEGFFSKVSTREPLMRPLGLLPRSFRIITVNRQRGFCAVCTIKLSGHKKSC